MGGARGMGWLDAWVGLKVWGWINVWVGLKNERVA